MKQNGGVVALTGVAQSNERVSELLRNLSSNSPWLARPELAEIVAGNVQVGKDQRRVANFRMSVKLLRSSEVKAVAKAPAAGASGPAIAPGAAVPASAAVAVAAPVPPAAPAPAAAPVPAVKK